MKVRITNTDGKGYTTKITNAETGEDIPGVFRMVLIPAGHAITAQIDAYADVDIIADAEVRHICPGCGRPVDE